MKQLSDCCKAEIKLTGSPEHKDAFACAKCGRIIGTPIKKIKPNNCYTEIIETAIQKQNKDREEFEKILFNFGTFYEELPQTVRGRKRVLKEMDKLWKMFQSYTKKKVEEEREKCKIKMAQSNEWWNKKIGLLIKGDK